MRTNGAGLLDDRALADAFAGASATVRRRAAELAARRPAVQVARLLGDAIPTVVEMACWACGEQEHPEPGPGAGPPRHRPRRRARSRSSGRGLDAILAACRDKPAIRRRAVLALAPFDGPEVDEALAHALADKDWQVRQAAEDLS